MPSLLLSIFVLQLLVHLINTFGAGHLNSLLWELYSRLPTSISTNVRRQTELRREIVRLKREMNATSSQDEFAKWAKLRRQHDKAVEDYERITQSLQSFKSRFDTAVTVLRWLGTNGLRFFIRFWFAKQPLFWLPRGWVPGYIEWILAFPRAPTGSISVQVWAIACASMIQIVSAGIIGVCALILEYGMMKSFDGRKKPLKMSAQTTKEKKEL